MSRVNFYQLLELKINPPESDPDVIDSAIKRKQSEWSRLRNHPTKGTQARQFISLVDEIRKTMADPKLREKEARNAVELIKKKLETKFKAIDNHVYLLCSKGAITEEEIARLAEFHRVKPQIIQRRVERWHKKHGQELEIYLNNLLIDGKPDEKTLGKIASQFQTTPETVHDVLKKLIDERFAELEAYINIQIRKGFMSEREISSLSEIYALDQGEILRRVRCPIKKGSPSDSEHAYRIDSTVEQVINENLKIVEQDSLYGFLGLFPGSSLEALQNKAIEKEKEVRKISQKDAFVTASGVLAGQCISIFKSDESRYAYDLSRARSLLKNLSKDISLAISNNALKLEYYHYLLRKAVSFGTLPDEARQHILEFCQTKSWKVEQPKKKHNLKRYARVALVTLTVLLVAGSIFWYFYFKQQRLEQAYAETLQKADEQPSLEAQIRIFKTYLADSDDEQLRERAANQIASLQRRIAQRDFQSLSQNAEKLYAERQYEDILALYDQFLSHHGNSAWADEIRDKSAKLPGLVDERDYQNLGAIPIEKPEEIAYAATAYLQQHPDGQHIAQVRNILRKVEAPYYRDVEEALAQCETNEDWNQCIRLSNRYIDIYRDSRYALNLKEKRDVYQINLQNKIVLDALIAKAGGKDADPEKVRFVLEQFLQNAPNSPAVPLVQVELTKTINQLARRESQLEMNRLQQLLIEKKGRFSIKRQDTVFDSKTGLTWTLLDSRLSAGKCMTYDEAKQYVKSMKTGGYSDWRLPTAQELSTLFSGPDPFPGAASNWYWSADSLKRYSGGWLILVDVVRSLPSGLSIAKQDASDCGWFRAVRP
jgi:hypothetical protein